MIFWNILSYGAWILSAVILVWLVADMLKINKEYGEDYLLSSREGEDLLMEELEEKRHE